MFRLNQRRRNGSGESEKGKRICCAYENVVVIVGAAEGEAAGLAAETVTAGDPTFAGPLTGVQLGLTTYHVCEPELKEEFDPAVYDEQVGMMEMVLDVDDIVDEMSAIRDEYCKYL